MPDEPTGNAILCKGIEKIMRTKNVLPNHAAQLYGVLTGLESVLIASVDPALLQRQLSVLNQILYQLEKQR